MTDERSPLELDADAMRALLAEALAIGRWAHDFAEPLRREAEGHDD